MEALQKDVRLLKESMAISIYKTKQEMSLAAISMRKVASLKDLRNLLESLEKRDKDF